MLDIDGVLNLIPQGFDEYGAIFHPHFVDNLKELIDATGAKIVVSSSWRWAGLTNMKEMWKDRKLPGEVVDITPYDFQLVRKGKFNHEDDIVRGDEIQDWLETNTYVTNYVIIDDDEDFLEHQIKDHFVKTSENHDHFDKIDWGYGLTKECTRQAIEILNR
jgi:hypothetical protein